jgi:hypothetical protein
MATITKNRANEEKKTVVDKIMKSYAYNPFFIRKREAAIKLLKMMGDLDPS